MNELFPLAEKGRENLDALHPEVSQISMLPRERHRVDAAPAAPLDRGGVQTIDATATYSQPVEARKPAVQERQVFRIRKRHYQGIAGHSSIAPGGEAVRWGRRLRGRRSVVRFFGEPVPEGLDIFRIALRHELAQLPRVVARIGSPNRAIDVRQGDRHHIETRRDPRENELQLLKAAHEIDQQDAVSVPQIIDLVPINPLCAVRIWIFGVAPLQKFGESPRTLHDMTLKTISGPTFDDVTAHHLPPRDQPVPGVAYERELEILIPGVGTIECAQLDGEPMLVGIGLRHA